MDRPKLGAAVEFDTTLLRVHNDKGTVVSWVPTKGKALRGVYAGMRTVYEGSISRHRGGYAGEYDYEPGYLSVSRSVTHALVVVSERAKPVRVPFDALRELTATPKERDHAE